MRHGEGWVLGRGLLEQLAPVLDPELLGQRAPLEIQVAGLGGASGESDGFG